MPYTISHNPKKKGGYVVRKKSTGEIIAGNKTKLSQKKAGAVIGAIEANEKK